MILVLIEPLRINVVATGHVTTGIKRLWSTLDLSPLKDIATDHVLSSIISVAFSFDSQDLYASFNDKFLVILARSPKSDSNNSQERPTT